MKRIKMLALVFLIPLFMFGCASSEPVEEKSIFEQYYGTYEVKEGWVKANDVSSDSITFYVKSGDEDLDQPNNVAIKGNKTKFAADKHEEFKDAIVSQVNEQIPEDMDVDVKVDGKTNKSGDVYYVVGIDEGDIATKFYYILADHKFVTIQATSFDKGDEVFEVADHMADTFVWTKE